MDFYSPWGRKESDTTELLSLKSTSVRTEKIKAWSHRPALESSLVCEVRFESSSERQNASSAASWKKKKAKKPDSLLFKSPLFLFISPPGAGFKTSPRSGRERGCLAISQLGEVRKPTALEQECAVAS